MNAKERLEFLDREAEAADEAYRRALDAEHIPMMSRFQPTLLGPRVRALKEALDLASMRRHKASVDFERERT